MDGGLDKEFSYLFPLKALLGDPLVAVILHEKRYDLNLHCFYGMDYPNTFLPFEQKRYMYPLSANSAHHPIIEIAHNQALQRTNSKIQPFSASSKH